MADESVRLFRLAMDAYADGDADLAGALDDMDDRLDELHRDYIQAILELYADVRDVQAAVQLALVGRYYERIGDHAVNIGERVQYMVTGWLPEHTSAGRRAALMLTRPAGGRRARAGHHARPRVRRPEAAGPPAACTPGAGCPTTSCRPAPGWPRPRRWSSGPSTAPLLWGGEGSMAEARLASALAVIPQGVVVFDDDGTIAYRNEVAAELPHRPARRRAGGGGDRRAGRGSPPPRRTACRPRTVDLFGPPRRTLVLTAIPLHEGGRRLGVLVVIDDVTDRRRLEAVRRDFVANISHELKTPVGALALLAETLLAEDDAAVAQRLAERMLAEAFRVGRTIDDLLELSRIEADEEARRDDVPVHLVIAEAVDRVRPAAEQQGITIEVEEPPQRLAVGGDRRQLVSATYNLLENAVKYSDHGLERAGAGPHRRPLGRRRGRGPRHRDPPA